MAELPMLRLRVEMDPEKMAAFDNAIDHYRNMSDNLEVAARNVRTALLDLQDAIVFKKED